MVTLFDHTGKKLNLGKQIGNGGEGAIYEVTQNVDMVAKIYHQEVTKQKASKIIAMAQASTPALTKISAWPETVLFDHSRKVKGFTMRKIIDHHEVHDLYGPRHRKNIFPEAKWDFLIRSAGNIASSFAAIHQAGHVIGDVNQGNVLISKQATCTLIDCDSFQINLNGHQNLCEVGVPEFTPPELQGRNFRGIQRTEHHDNFGLAVICFHLLFMGRHPFVGRYQGSGDMPVEKAIEEYRFAFGKNSKNRQMLPPPNTIPLDSASPALIELFEQAFSKPTYSHGARPTAIQWAKELDDFYKTLKSCSYNKSHLYYQGHSICPWCNLEIQSGVIFFFSVSNALSGITDTFDLKTLWGEIQKIKPLAPFVLPPIPEFNLTPKPLSKEAITAKKIQALNCGGVIFSAIFFAIFIIIYNFNIQLLPKEIMGLFYYINWIFIATGLATAFGIKGKDGGELQERKNRLKDTSTGWIEFQKRMMQESSGEEFRAKLKDLEEKKLKYIELQSKFKNKTKTEIMNYYLDQFYIDKVKINGVGDGRKMTLASYGIETAADISEMKISGIKGFGPKLVGSLMLWKNSLEHDFLYKPNPQILKIAEQSRESDYKQKLNKLEKEFTNAPQDLQNIQKKILNHREALHKRYNLLARNLEQSRADASVTSLFSWQ